MSKIAVTARLEAKPESNALVLEVARALVASTADEAGTEVYVLNQDPNNPNVFWFYELYSDQAALDAHLGSAAMADAFGKLADALAEPPALHVLTPLTATGISVD